MCFPTPIGHISHLNPSPLLADTFEIIGVAVGVKFSFSLSTHWQDRTMIGERTAIQERCSTSSVSTITLRRAIFCVLPTASSTCQACGPTCGLSIARSGDRRWTELIIRMQIVSYCFGNPSASSITLSRSHSGKTTPERSNANSW